MPRIVIPSSTDWLQSADFASGTVLVEGRLAEMLHPELWTGAVGAWAYALDPRPWDYSGRGLHLTRTAVTDAEDGWSLNGTTSNLSLARPAITAEPLTIAAWFRTNNVATAESQQILTLGNNGANGFWGLNYAANAGGDPVRALKQSDAATNVVAETTTGVSLNTWHHGVAIFAGVASRRVLLDGGSEGTNTDACPNPTPDITSIGVLRRNSDAAFVSGRIAEAAIWNRVLTTAEIKLLASKRNIAYECRLQPKRFFFN